MAGVLAYENLLDHGACGDFFLDDDNLSPRPHSQSMDESSVPESVGVFEGPEKTLEVCFLPGVGRERGCRDLTRAQLDTMLTEARCTILSHISNAHLDAYVLSESPAEFGGLGLKLEWVGYSRKNYAFPDEQPSPHTSFGEELAYLRAHRDVEKDADEDGGLDRSVGGAAAAAAFDGQGYVLGPITGDHWFVYVADQCERPAASATERTINIMMFDLGEDVRDAFYLKPGEKGDLRSAARAMTARSGLGALIPSSSHLDDHAFAPCGYSMNALCFESYTTVHVTPEASCSYASFETNTALKGYASLVKNVLAVFKPKKLDINPLGTYHRNDLSLLHVEHDCVCMMANYSLHDKNSPHKRRDSPYRDVDRAGHVGSLQ
ncbi:hypothetical protein JL721_11092 [Aureococcus anophagefferens]|nr:hypothetical protein JL721_11092 [Aureococcus anophagefferens]